MLSLLIIITKTIINIIMIFRCVKEVKEKTGMRLTIKVSALEIAGNREELRDLLVSFRGQEVQPQGKRFQIGQ